MIELDPPALTPEKARSLLRRLRDLNLFTAPVAIGAGRSVAIAGCLSIDAPVESGVRYRAELEDGAVVEIELAWRAGGLEVAVTTPGAHPERRSLSIELCCDPKGRACARLLAARVSPESRDRRELEHFFRRIVRTAFKA